MILSVGPHSCSDSETPSKSRQVLKDLKPHLSYLYPSEESWQGVPALTLGVVGMSLGQVTHLAFVDASYHLA
jgi:hypothetical protein